MLKNVKLKKILPLRMLWCVVFEVKVIISSAVNSMALYLDEVFTFSFIFSSPHVNSAELYQPANMVGVNEMLTHRFTFL